MERRLLEAARKGNIHELDDLISTNEQILEEMALEGAGHTPLHVACVGGHLDFVRELLKHMPKLAEKVNPGGFSPLHIVAARGDVEIAEELLNVGTHLCSLKGRERRIPLHYAVENGEVNVMKVLLSKSPESVEETTALEETALHLAVKNNRFDAVVVLVDHLKQHKKEQVINWKDHKGNTALHLAAAAKNFEVVDFLLRGHAVELEVVDVNARNESGLMPLDVLTLSQRGERDREIREILTRAGSVPTSIPVRGDDDDDVEVVNSPQSLPRSQSVTSFQLVERFDFPEFMLVIATLIATLTYQAVLQPPISVQVDNNSTKGTHVAYIVFMSVNTFALLMSARIIIFCTSVTPFMLSLVPPVVAVVLTYILLLVFLPFKSIDKQSLPITVGLLGVLPLIISVLLLLIRKCLAHFFGRYVAQQRNANLQQHQMEVSRRGQILM